ncbi:MAG: FKBP-type peptidyl-prolyl cis-trans isomerase [Dysgonamonadaceae bacterium]|jgi:FKBP-type peptidyl-prolyl cis-trans isomerase FklB|nr:FKBP-type peptidyl-prolyl cis-trans isomerase [Dysgonamonadaceae bacterium]
MEKLSYAIGMSMAQNLMQSGLKSINIDSFVKAFTDVMNNASTNMSFNDANIVLQEYFTKQQDEMLNQNLEIGHAFLEENKKNANIVTLPSGLQYEILTEGTGEKPKATDTVKCHYHGTLIDGTVFDSSVERGQPASFGVNQVIKGWVEALQLMPVGSKWRLFIPSELAYGKQGAGGAIQPNSALVFDVELLGIEK